jgi:hypothetical protein
LRAAYTLEATQNITDSNRIARAGLKTAESLEKTLQRRESDRVGSENRRKLQEED